MRKHITIVFLSLFIFTSYTFASAPPDIIGEAAILIDSKTGTVLYDKNSNSKMYPASTTKILTSLIIIENSNLTHTISKSLDSVNSVPADSSHTGLEIGDEFSVLDGIYAVMLGSDNYVSHDLALYLDGSIPDFANRMNRKAKEIGVTSSNFVNPHGYHDPNHYTTASDLVNIAKYAFQNPMFRSIASAPDHKLYRLNNPDNFIDITNTVELIIPDSKFYNPDSIGGKTGFHTPAGKCLVAAANKDDMEVIAVILKSSNSNSDHFNDMNSLFNYAFDNFSVHQDANGDYISNDTYSPWAKDIVSVSIYNGFTNKYSTDNYKNKISKKNFIKLLMRSVSLAQREDLTNISDEKLIAKALQLKIINNDSILSDFYNPITREEVTYIVNSLLDNLNYHPLAVHPITLYNDHRFIGEDYLQNVYDLQQNGLMGSPKDDYFHPKEILTLEQALSVINTFYDFYSNSMRSYINSAS